MDNTKTKKNNKPNINIINILTTVKNYYSSIKNTVHVKAYERAIYQIKKWNKPITNGLELKDLEGIGKGMIEKINTILKIGTLPIIQEHNLTIVNSNSNNKLTLKNILGFGDKFISRLKNNYNIQTIPQLQKYIKTYNNISLTKQQFIGLQYHNDLIIPISRLETQLLFNLLIDEPSIQNLIQQHKLFFKLAGSYPSGKTESKDIDILIATPRYQDITKQHLMNKIIKAIQSIKFCLKIENINNGIERSKGLIH